MPDLITPSGKRLRHVLRAQDLDREILAEIFRRAQTLEEKEKRGEYDHTLRNKHLVFYTDQATSRTRYSTCLAWEKLGGSTQVISRGDSSQEKGESLEDTVITFAEIGADAIAIRYSDEGEIFRAAAVSPIPIINCGSGSEQHPTQALLDAYTIHQLLGQLDGCSIAFIGDLKYGRTVNSLAYLLSKFQEVRIYFVSPDNLRLKGDLIYYLKEKGVQYEETSDLEYVLDKVQILYQTRAQREHAKDSADHANLAPYVINRRTVEKMSRSSFILHPLPRNYELAREIDGLSQAQYLRQMRHGRFARQGLLQMIGINHLQ